MPSAHDVGRILARNTAWNYAGFLANIATNLVAFPYVVSRLGDGAAGIWLLLGALTGYMGLLELGMVPSLAQFVAAARGRGADSEVRRAAATALAILVGLALVPLAMTLAVPRGVGLLDLDSALVGPATLAIQVAIVGFALRMPLATLQALLLGTQRQDLASQLWILMGWAKFACAFAVLESGGGLVGLVLAEAVVHLAGGLLQWRWVRRELPWLSMTSADVDAGTARTLVTYGASLLVLGLSVLIVEQTDRIVIAAFLPIEQVTLYSAAWKLYMFAYAVPTTLVQAMSPMVATLYGQGDAAAIRELFLRMGRYSMAVAVPIVCTLAACRDWLLALWMGERFVAAGPVVIALLVAFYVTSHNHAGWSVLAGKRRLGHYVYAYNGPLAVLNLALSLALVRPLGILGVAIGTMVPALLLQPVFVRATAREVGVPIRQMVSEIVRPTSGLALPAFLPLLVSVALTPSRSPIRFAVAAACSLLFLAAFWRWGLTGEERGAAAAWLPFGWGTRIAR